MLCGPWHRERTAVIVTVSVAAVRRINTELFLRKNVKDRHGLILCFFWGGRLFGYVPLIAVRKDGMERFLFFGVDLELC